MEFLAAYGPYITYWYISDSDSVYARDQYGRIRTTLEPKNNTLEVGIKVSYHF